MSRVDNMFSRYLLRKTRQDRNITMFMMYMQGGQRDESVCGKNIRACLKRVCHFAQNTK